MAISPVYDGPPIDDVPYIPSEGWQAACHPCGQSQGILRPYPGVADDGWTGRVYSTICGHAHWRWED